MNTYQVEREMYKPVRQWLHHFLRSRFRGAQIDAYDSSELRLSRLIEDKNLYEGLPPDWPTWDIQVDVTGFAQSPNGTHLALVECKLKPLTLDHLAQLLGYARIARPHFAFLISPQGLKDPLRKLLTVYQRLDVLEYFAETDHMARALILARWDVSARTIAFDSLVTTDSQKVELGRFS